MQNKKITKVILTVVFLAVVAFLVFITINKKENMGSGTEVKGVGISILEQGTGEEAKAGDSVSVNYTGKLSDGTVFDSNILPEFGHVEPFTFTIGAGQVIQGWEQGVAGMKTGEKRMLVISPEMAYGETGAGGVIPPNATISFEVQLLEIIK